MFGYTYYTPTSPGLRYTKWHDFQPIFGPIFDTLFFMKSCIIRPFRVQKLIQKMTPNWLQIGPIFLSIAKWYEGRIVVSRGLLPFILPPKPILG